jgi:hypothetical protein
LAGYRCEAIALIVLNAWLNSDCGGKQRDIAILSFAKPYRESSAVTAE